MKRKVVILILCAIITLLATACSNSTNADTNKAEKDNKEKISSLQNKVDCYNKIYDDKIKKSIDKYCEYYLSFEDCIDVHSVKKLKNYLTSDLYSNLLNQPYSEGMENEQGYYLQSTSVDELFYEDISAKIKFYSTINETIVLAICSQSVISDNATTCSNNIYKFKMEYRSNQWLISSVEAIR